MILSRYTYSALSFYYTIRVLHHFWLICGFIWSVLYFVQVFTCLLKVSLLFYAVSATKAIKTAPHLVAFYDRLGIRRTYPWLKTPGVPTGCMHIKSDNQVGIQTHSFQTDRCLSDWASIFKTPSLAGISLSYIELDKPKRLLHCMTLRDVIDVFWYLRHSVMYAILTISYTL